MTNFNPVQAILSSIQAGANPQAVVNRMAQTNPAIGQAMRIVNGKTPDQVKNLAYSIAKQKGINLNELARHMGIRLPE